MKFEVGDVVVLNDGSEVLLLKDCGAGFQARHVSNGMKEPIRTEWIVGKAQPKPGRIWDDLAARMEKSSEPGRAPAALVAAVKVDRKVQYLPSYGAINAIPYLFQYTPLFALRRSPWGRILVADETGLGKTVEAGIVLEELFRSQDPAEMIGSVLVIGPKSLQSEWRGKMMTHFERTVEPTTLKELIGRLTSRRKPEGGEVIHYLSMDALPGLLDKDRLRDEDIVADNLYDMVIVDEAHHFKNAGSKRRRALAKLLGEPLRQGEFQEAKGSKQPRLLLLTATPLSTSIENLFSYFTLMDPSLASVDTLERQQMAFQNEHRRVVMARRLSNLVFRVYFERDNAEASGRLRAFLADPSHRRALLDVESDLEAHEAFETLARFSENPEGASAEVLADALLSLDPWCDMVVRNTRRGVELQGDTQVLVDNRCVQLHAEEVRKANKVPFWNMEPLAQVTYRQMLASSIHSLVHRDAIHALAATSPDREEWGGDLTAASEEGEPEVYSDGSGAFLSQPLTRPELLGLPDAKFESLLEALESFFVEKGQKGGLLFTRFTATGSYLHMRLLHEARPGGRFPGLRVEYIHGGIPAENRAKLMEDLKEEAGEVCRRADAGTGLGPFEGAQLVVLTEVGQEGVDLQFCTGVFHYDLPWNPMRLVQRNGRVHRIGQRSPVVYIHTFFVDGSLDLRISQAIALRMQMVYETFGDLPDGLFGGEAGESLREFGVEGHLLLQDLLKGKEKIDLQAELERRATRIDAETHQIKLHQEQIQKLLSDEAETCQAWRPLVQEALHGSFGSLERVLRSDVEALLDWSTENGSNVNAQRLDEDSGEWDLQWSTLDFKRDRTGALGRAARRALATLNRMTAQVLPDDNGKSRLPGLEPWQVLHLAHPIVASIATRTLSDFKRPMLLASSPGINRPCALVCLEFEIKDDQHTRTENRWFLMEPPAGQPLDAPWVRVPQRGSAERVHTVLSKAGPWDPMDPASIEAAVKGLQEGLEVLHLSIYEEERERRRRQEIKRRVRHLRHLGRIIDHWTAERRERQSRVAYQSRQIDLMEVGSLPDGELDRYRRYLLPAAQRELNRVSKELERLTAIQHRLVGEVQDLRSEGVQEIRVAVFDERPDALLMIQPQGVA